MPGDSKNVFVHWGDVLGIDLNQLESCAGAEDYHNLQVSDAFGVKPGGSVTLGGPRSCYIPNEYAPSCLSSALGLSLNSCVMRVSHCQQCFDSEMLFEALHYCDRLVCKP